MTLRIETEIKVGEASWAGMAARRRWGVGGWTTIVGGLLLGFASCWVGDFLAGLVGRTVGVPDRWQWLLNLAFALAALIIFWLLLGRRLLNYRYSRRIAERGHPGPFRTTHEITDQAYVYVIGGITRQVSWPVISEIFPVQGWWVLMAQGESLYIPTRAFAGRDEERVFVQAILERLSEPARVRSKAASAFAGAH